MGGTKRIKGGTDAGRAAGRLISQPRMEQYTTLTDVALLLAHLKEGALMQQLNPSQSKAERISARESLGD